MHCAFNFFKNIKYSLFNKCVETNNLISDVFHTHIHAHNIKFITGLTGNDEFT